MKAIWKKYWRWALAAVCLLLFLLLAAAEVNGSIGWLDAGAYGAAQAVMCGPVTAVMKLVTNAAHPATLLVLTIVLIFAMKDKRYWFSVIMNIAAAALLNLALKAIFLRGRPMDVTTMITETGYSFPSGHAMAMTAFYGYLIFLVWQFGWSRAKKITATALLGAFILLVGFSRVYLGVHYGSDVLAGMCVTIPYLVAFSAISKRYLARGEDEPMERNSGKRDEGLLASFGHAFRGIRGGLKTERNMMIHFSAMALVILFGFLCRISASEWLCCIVLFGLVIALELVSTAIETVVDIAQPEIDPRAKLAKDTAAGAVLAAAIAAAAVGAVIFLPKILALITNSLQ